MLAVGALKNCPQGRQARRLVSPPQKRTLNSLTITPTDSVERFSKHSVVCSFVYTTHPASAKCQELGRPRQAAEQKAKLSEDSQGLDVCADNFMLTRHKLKP